MQTLIITRADLDDTNTYVGATDVSDFAGHIEIAADLGHVHFTGSLRAAGSVRALAGSGIKAGSGIEAGWGIEAGSGIEAGWGIEAGLSVSAKFVAVRLRIFAGLCLWRQPTREEMQIRAEVRSGTVAFGEVVAPVETAVE